MRVVPLCLIALCVLPFAELLAQPSQATSDAWKLVPPDGVALVTVQVNSIVNDESMRMMPWEVITAWAKSR